jgi:hypothetical protein
VRCRGRRLFGYFFFAAEEKVTRSPQASGSSCFKKETSKIKMDSSLRRDDEPSKDTGFQPALE